MGQLCLDCLLNYFSQRLLRGSAGEIFLRPYYPGVHALVLGQRFIGSLNDGCGIDSAVSQDDRRAWLCISVPRQGNDDGVFYFGLTAQAASRSSG